MRSLLTIAVLLLVLPVNAGQFRYVNYSHDSFAHLKFDVWDSWSAEQNELETVFTKPDYELPQLFFQTVGKNDQFHDSVSFLRFLEAQDESSQYRSVRNTTASGYPAIWFESQSAEFPDINSIGLVVDVGGGLLYFYLNHPVGRSKEYFPLIERVRSSLDFQ